MPKGRVLVLGATGFIGRRIVAAVLEAGYEVAGGVRRPAMFMRMFPGCRAVSCDLARDVAPADWLPRLAGIDVVVNCAGVLQDRHSRAIHVEAPRALHHACADAGRRARASGRDGVAGPAAGPGLDPRRLHVEAPRALHHACAEAGVRRIVHISAISAQPGARTAYAEEKQAAEADLQSGMLDWVILRPSLVFAEGSHGGTSALRGIAAMPWVVPLPGGGNQRFSPIHAGDLARAVALLLAPEVPGRRVLVPCGPETMTLREIVLAWRSWLGLPKPTLLPVPMALVRAMSRVVDWFGGGPLSSTAVKQLEFGNAGDGRAFAAAIGFAPRPMREWLRARPSSVQDKWHARLFFLRPLLRWLLGLSWIASGTIGFFGGASLARSALATLGWEVHAVALQWATCLLDIAIGIAVLARFRPAGAFVAQCVTVIGYTIVLSIAAPALWLDPLGPLAKNAAFLGLAAVVAALEDDR